MKRRDLVKNGILAAGLAGVAPVFGFLQNNVKIGVMINLFRMHGYEALGQAEITEYASYKVAQQDLEAGKIDLLISSTHFLLGEQTQLSLFGQFPEHYLDNQNKSEWIAQNYNHVADVHAQRGLSAEYVGSLSPLLVRFSRISYDELAGWKNKNPKIKIAASGIRSTWFDHIGFDVHGGSFKNMADKQLVNLHSDRLQVTDAFSPALFLKAMLFLKSIEGDDRWELKQIIEQAKSEKSESMAQSFKSFQNFQIIRDAYSKSSLPVEILYRKESSPAITASLAQIKASLKSFLENDEKYQQEILDIMVQKFKITYQDTLPEALCHELRNCTDAFLNALSEQSSPVAAQLVNSYCPNKRG